MLTTDYTELGTSYLEVAMQLGKIEAAAEERGFLSLDCTVFALKNLEMLQESLGELRRDLQDLYRRITFLSEGCKSIPEEKVRDVFVEQIKYLHGKRGSLEQSLRLFHSFLQPHFHYKILVSDVNETQEQVYSYERRELVFDQWAVLSDKIEMLMPLTQIVFSKKDKNSCLRHQQASSDLYDRLNTLRLQLHLSRNKWRKELEKLAKQNVERLLEEGGEERVSLLLSLPRRLQAKILKKAQLFSVALKEGMQELTLLEDQEVLRKNGGKMICMVQYAHEKFKESYFNPMEGLFLERKLKREELLNQMIEESRECFEKLVKIPNGVQEALQKALFHFPEYQPDQFVFIEQREFLSLDLLECQLEESIVIEERELLFSCVEQLVPPKKSLEMFREHVIRVKQLPPKEQEEACCRVLQGAERDGINLGGFNGVYYWVWFLAHQKDSRAGGEDFGKIQAPKDLDRLIEAIDLALKSQFMAGVRRLQLRSLGDLKQQVERVSRFNGGIELLLKALLSVAERSGLPLNGDGGVYYWIWFLAHEKDSNVGGDDFGKIEAPKDVKRLLAAIDKASDL